MSGRSWRERRSPLTTSSRDLGNIIMLCVCVCVCVCACVCACVRACVDGCVCLHVCNHVCVGMHVPFSLSPPPSDVAQRCYCGSSNCRGYLGQSKQATPLRVATTRSLRDIGSPREGGWRRRSAARSENQEDYLVSVSCQKLF